ncbi:hypothetical protein C8R45DRAFT_946846 [Mycena sanguinolenta]|nr:hypothetical protein C8R45DRAFT_946846 [Mycena sanguinolenta]
MDPPFLSLDTPVHPKFRRGNKHGRASSPTRRRTTSPPLKKPKSQSTVKCPWFRNLLLDHLLEFSGVASVPKKASAAPVKRPVIKTRAPRKSVTPSDEYIPPVDTLDDGKSEVPDEDDPQADSLCGHHICTDNLPIRGLGKDSRPFTGARTQLPVEALGFALRDYQHVKIIPIVLTAWLVVSNALARVLDSNAKNARVRATRGVRIPCLTATSSTSQKTCPLLPKLAHILLDFDRARKDLLAIEAVYVHAQHRFDLAAHVLGDWMQGILASYDPQALPGMDLVPETLRDTWLAMLDVLRHFRAERSPRFPCSTSPLVLPLRILTPFLLVNQSPGPERQVERKPAEEEEEGEITEDN